MAFDNQYPKRKDWRKGYHGSARYDKGCRPGGDCEYCRSNRTHKHKRRRPQED